MQRKILPLASLGLAVFLTGCTGMQGQSTADASTEVSLPLAEIDRLVEEYRKASTDDPSVENLRNLNRMLTIREHNVARLHSLDTQRERAPFGDKHRQVSRNYTLDWDNAGRGGAAMRQPAYVHTLAGYNTIHAPAEVSDELAKKQKAIHGASRGDKSINAHPAMLDKAMKIGLSFGEPDSDHSYSIYEMSRWERFCNDGGKEMDKRDWDFVKKHGANNLPLHLRATCNPPKKVF